MRVPHEISNERLAKAVIVKGQNFQQSLPLRPFAQLCAEAVYGVVLIV